MATKSIATLRRRADKLYQQVGMKDNPSCLICGKPASCLHHYIPKSQSSNLRYDLNNGIPICMGCHLKHHRGGDPHIVETILLMMGREWSNDLCERRRIIRKFNKGYLREVIERLEGLL